MNSKPAALAFALAAFIAVCASASAQTAPAATATATGAAAPAPKRVVLLQQRDDRTERGEPEVRHTVIEDQGSKIDELRVRGQVQHVVVTPKVGTTRPYEIIVSRSGRDPVDGTGGANSAVGKRVWNVLAF